MLKNKVILITGSTNGIGRAAAKRCVEQGARVMVHGRQEDRAQALVAELGEQSAHYVIADLENDQEAPNALVAATVSKWGRLDGLVNNAGIYPRNTIDSVDVELYQKIMQVNFHVPLLICKAAMKPFRQQGRGAIVNIGSMNAYCGQTDLLIYSCSKGALMTMTRNLADSLGPEQVRVNQLNVGWTATENEMALKRSEGLPDNWQEKIPKVYAPSGRLLSPENVAEHIVFWLSDRSAPVSGAVYEVEQYPIIGRNRLNDLVINE
ncbi:SDR family NAD(P)-dependent oxidoreductase [Rickettsiella massiliensis]|uniref:SDR family NAD(P)-dependent oxidoreductase n=1 Tax=Rickettsiella massiliensis TaxID=676517 RepID=UPI00029B32FD|nr:SDR family NAD(P)-dependent oxidoreductase [Rickettsiella massiliensis]